MRAENKRRLPPRNGQKVASRSVLSGHIDANISNARQRRPARHHRQDSHRDGSHRPQRVRESPHRVALRRVAIDFERRGQQEEHGY